MITHALISGPSSAACAISGTGSSNPSTKAPPAAAVLASNERRSICPVAVMATSKSFSSAGRSVDSGTDALVGATAADIGDRVINIGVGRFWPILEQRHNGHDHSALAVSALRDIVINPRLVDGVERAVLGKSLDGRDLCPRRDRGDRH